MNIKTNLIEEYVNFVDNTKKPKKTMDIYNYTCIYTVNYTHNYNN